MRSVIAIGAIFYLSPERQGATAPPAQPSAEIGRAAGLFGAAAWSGLSDAARKEALEALIRQSARSAGLGPHEASAKDVLALAGQDTLRPDDRAPPWRGILPNAGRRTSAAE